MEIEIDLSKTIEENATMYYNKSKDARKQLWGYIKLLKWQLRKVFQKKKKLVK